MAVSRNPTVRFSNCPPREMLRLPRGEKAPVVWSTAGRSLDDSISTIVRSERLRRTVDPTLHVANSNGLLSLRPIRHPQPVQALTS